MYDYLRRFLIVFAVALSIGLLFLGATVSFAASEDKYEVANFIWPTEGLISDTFGTRSGKHYGIDIAAPRGTPVVSVCDGIVTKSYYSSTYGNVVFIEHTDQFESVYAHLHERLVSEGTHVKEGDKIGTVGNTGRSSGDHLHFEVHDGSWSVSKRNAIDPLLVLSDVLNDEYQVASSAINIKELEDNIDLKGMLVVKVKEGDSLWSLSERYQVPIKQIMAWNDLSTETIVVDQPLKIVQRGIYYVQQGDTLSKISEESGVPISKIKQINGLKNDTIQAGVLLKIENYKK